MESDTTFNLKDFTIKEKLYSGVSSEVYKVIENSTSKMFAVKISQNQITPKLKADLAEIRQKALFISKLGHPSIIKSYGYNETDFNGENKLVTLMEYMRNYSLDQIFSIKQRSFVSKYLTNTRKLIIIYGIASGMSCLHKNNIIHQNLKPTNVLMDDFLLPKITDITLSAFNNSIHKSSIAFIAPEILNGSKYTQSSDVYSFGQIMYQIVTNERPFKKFNFSEIIQRVKKGERPTFNVPVPNSYQSLIEKCWSQDPKERPSFDEILTQLQNDAGFITDTVDKDDYQNFIRYIQACQDAAQKQEEMQPIDSFVDHQSATFVQCDIQNAFVRLMQLVNSEAKITKPKLPTRAKSTGVRTNRSQPAVIAPAQEAATVKPPETERKESGNGRTYSKSGITDPKGLTEILGGPPTAKASQKVQAVVKPPPTKEEVARQVAEEAFQGNSEALFKYAGLLEKGEGVAEDKVKALLLYKLLGEEGNLDALMKYGELKMNDVDLPDEKADRAKLFKELADKGLVQAMSLYAELLNGEGEPHDFEEAAKYFKLAAEKGDVFSIGQYGKMLMSGIGVDENIDEASKYLKDAADAGNVQSMYLYALIRYGQLKSAVEVDKEEATAYFKCAADQGHETSMFYYGLILSRGDVIPADKEEGLRYIQMAAQHGDKCAALKLKADESEDPRDMVSYGDQMLDFHAELNFNEAIFYYKKAADKDDAEGMISYAQAVGSLQLENPNFKEAAKYYKKAISKGEGVAMNNLGMYLLFGQGCPVDKQGAATLFIMAAEKGRVLGMLNYAHMCYIGDGIPVDKAEAERYYKMAVDSGEINMIYKFGKLFYKGEEYQMDKRHAARYFKMAADNGCEKAMLKLSKMLMTGDGIPQNDREGTKYLRMAIARNLRPEAMLALLLARGHL